MLDSLWISLPVSAVLGFLSGLGTGGGSLLILWLTVVLDMDPVTARCINLMFFIPSALIACVFRQKQGGQNLKRLFPAVIAGCAAAFGTSLLTAQMDLSILKKLFGALLIFTGIRELLYKPKAGH